MTALDIISSAMRLTGALAQGETPSNDEATEFLQVLNDMLDRWLAERLTVYSISDTLYNLQANKGSYQIGTGAADFNVTRPARIERASFVQSGTALRFQLDLKNAGEWAMLQERTRSAQLPDSLYPDYAFPIMTLYLDPIPSLGGQLELWAWQIIESFATLTTEANFPPGYDEAVRYNLAVRLAPELQMQMDPTVIQVAMDSKASIQKFNATIILGLNEGMAPAPPTTQPDSAPGPQ